MTFENPDDASVQVVTATLTATNSATINLGTAVDPATTMLVARAASAGSGADIGERLARVHLSSSTTVEVTRLVAGDQLDVTVQVIDFADGTVVQRGIENMAAGTATATVAINPVDMTRSSGLTTVAGPGSLSGGATDMVSTAIPGEASATVEVSAAAAVTLTRVPSSAAASFGWQVVEWGGPGWWDGSYPFRRRIDVTTTSVAAPGGYTVPFTVDHLSLINDGMAEASGHDLRVLR